MMLALAPRPTAVYLCVGPTDMRKGFDGLMRVAAEQAVRDVLQGGLFVFVNRRRDRVKLLWWDEDGLAIWYKRLEAGTFELPAIDDEARHVVLTAADLALRLGGIDLASVRRRKRYRRTA
jgi:transposase